MLAKRGFSAVHLVEAEPEIGGRLRWTRRLPTLGDWGADHRLARGAAGQAARRRGDHRPPAARGATSWTTAPRSGRDRHRLVLAGGRGPARPARPMPGADAALPTCSPRSRSCAGKRPPGPARDRLRHRRLLRRRPAWPSCWRGEGFEVTVVTSYPVLSPVSDHTLEGDMLRAHVHQAGGQGQRADHDHRDRAGLGAGPGRSRRPVVRQLRRGGAGHPAGLATTGCTTDWPATRPRWPPPGSRARVPDRRRGRAPDDLGGGLRRAPARPRDRPAGPRTGPSLTCARPLTSAPPPVSQGRRCLTCARPRTQSPGETCGSAPSRARTRRRPAAARRRPPRRRPGRDRGPARRCTRRTRRRRAAASRRPSRQPGPRGHPGQQHGGDQRGDGSARPGPLQARDQCWAGRWPAAPRRAARTTAAGTRPRPARPAARAAAR